MGLITVMSREITRNFVDTVIFNISKIYIVMTGCKNFRRSVILL